MLVRRRSGSGQPTREALPHTCQAVGALLSQERSQREWSLDEVAARLLLSKRQVLGLERADPVAFYTVPFFVKALRRYMHLTGLPSDLLDEADSEPPPAPELRLTLAEERLRPRSQGLSRARVAGIVLVALSVGAGITAWWRPTSQGADRMVPAAAPAPPLPSRPLESMSITPPPVTSRPAVVGRTPGDEVPLPAAAVRLAAFADARR
jgi:hypothetical protein